MAKLVIKHTGVAGVTESDGLNYTVLPAYTWPTAEGAETQLRQPTRNSCDPCASLSLSLSLSLSPILSVSLSFL